MAGQKERRNILDMIPLRSHDWEENDVVRIKVPRFKTRFGKRFCELIKKDKIYYINLDKIGTEAWKLIDGKRCVGDISKVIKEKFGEEVEPANERVSELFNIFEANGLISYKNEK